MKILKICHITVKALQKCSTCFSNSCWAVRGCQHSTYVPTVAGPTFNISTSARAEPGASPHTSKSCLLRPAKPPENRSQTHEISKILRRFVSQPLYEYQLPRLCHFRTHTKTVESEPRPFRSTFQQLLGLVLEPHVNMLPRQLLESEPTSN